MLHVPINIRQIPSPAQSPTVEQKDFIPKDDSAPIIVDNVEQILQEHLESPQVGSPNIHSNILTNSMDPSQVCPYFKFLFHQKLHELFSIELSNVCDQRNIISRPR